MMVYLLCHFKFDFDCGVNFCPLDEADISFILFVFVYRLYRSNDQKKNSKENKDQK